MDLKLSPFTPIHAGTARQLKQANATSLIPSKRENDGTGLSEETDSEKRPRSAPISSQERARFMTQHSKLGVQNVATLSEEDRNLCLEDTAVRQRLANEAEQWLQETNLNGDTPLSLEQARWVALRAPFLAKTDLQQKLLDAVFHYLDQAPQKVIDELSAIVDANAGQEPALKHPVLKELATGLHSIGMTGSKEQAVILLGCFTANNSRDMVHDAIINLLNILEKTTEGQDAERAFSQQGFIVSLEERIANNEPDKVEFMIDAFTDIINPSDDRKKAGWRGMSPLLCERFFALAQKHCHDIDGNGASALFWDLPKSIYFGRFPPQCHASALSLLHAVSSICRWDERNTGTSYIADILAEGILGSDVKSQKAVLDIFSDSKDFFDSVHDYDRCPAGHEVCESLNKAINAGYIDDTLLPRARDLAAELYKDFTTRYEGSDSEPEDEMSMYTDEEMDVVPQQNGINERPGGKQFVQAG